MKKIIFIIPLLFAFVVMTSCDSPRKHGVHGTHVKKRPPCTKS